MLEKNLVKILVKIMHKENTAILLIKTNKKLISQIKYFNIIS